MPVLSTLGAAIANVYGFTSGLIKDQYFNLVSLLLPGNGTNGKKNNDFVDSSSNNFFITPNGDVTQGTFSPFSQTGWGNYFDGTGDCLSIPTSAISSVGSNDFSMECWVYLLRQTNTLSQGLISYGVSGSTAGTSYISFELTPSGYAAVAFASATALAITSSTITPINQWAHIALCRSGSTLSIFLNGSRVATTSTSATVGSTGNVLFVGSQWYANEATRNLQGYISNARIVNGSSAYDATQSTINVPTLPLTAISNTSLLTCQSNRFKDSSSTPLTVTPSGNTSVTPFSPFAPTSSYSAAAVGGSGYFDGASDYLQFTDTSNSLDLGGIQASLEFWVYLTNTTVQNLFSKGGMNSGSAWSTTDGAEYAFAYNSGILYFTVNNAGGTLDLTGNFTTNQWNHVVIATNTSNAISMYINGTRTDTDTNAITKPTTRTTVRIGTFLLANWVYGYMCGIRHVTGSSAYDPTLTSITVPTSPPTVVSGTQFLCNFTNAGVVDATAKNVLETEGNAQISTAQSKWGGGSIYFASASNSNLLGNTPSNWTFLHDGSTWTVEFWLYPTNVSSFQGLIATNGAGSTNIGLSFAINAGAISISFTRGVSGSSASFTSSAVLNANQWNYVGVTFTGSTKTCAFFINGASAGSSSNTGFAYSSSTSTYPPYIGQTGDPSYPYYFNGYIDDLRITRGVARTITANPTAPFPVQ